MKTESVAGIAAHKEGDITPSPAESGRISTASVGILTLISMLAFFWLMGALFPTDPAGTEMSSAQITGMALTYSTTTAFLLASIVYMRRRFWTSIDELMQSGGLSPEGGASCGQHDVAMGLPRNAAATIVGLYLGGVQVTWGPIIDRIGEPNAGYSWESRLETC